MCKHMKPFTTSSILLDDSFLVRNYLRICYFFELFFVPLWYCACKEKIHYPVFFVHQFSGYERVRMLFKNYYTLIKLFSLKSENNLILKCMERDTKVHHMLKLMSNLNS